MATLTGCRICQTKLLSIMQYDKIIIKRPFKGYPQTFVAGEKVMYSHLTIEEYLKDNPDTEVISVEEYNKLSENFYISPFTEITLERFTEMLEVLPPAKWRTIGEWETFFLSEAMSGKFHSLYIRNRKTNKCYTGIKSILLSKEEILEVIEKEV